MSRRPPTGIPAATGGLRVVALATLAAAALAACGPGDGGGGKDGDGGGDARATGPAWFEDATDAAGIAFRHVRAPEIRFHFPEIMSGGGALLDMDDDGDLDLYLVQGGDLTGADPGDGNRLYRNRGDGTFEDVSATSGADDRSYGMGCTTGDYDNDGDVDIYITNVGANVLLRNDGDGTFTDVTTAAGVGDPGWGTSAAFVDYDADGDLDLFVVNYVNWSLAVEIECRAGSGERDYCKPNNYNSPSRDTLYRNEGDGTFTDVSEAAGVDKAFGNGLGVAIGDLDGDGRLDLYVANDGNPNQLWMNQGDGTFLDEALLAGCAVNMQGTAEAGMGVAVVDLEPDGDLDLFMTHLRDETNTFYVNRDGVFEDATSQTGLSTASIQYTGFGMGFADLDRDGRLDLFVANGRVGMWGPPVDPDDVFGEPNQVFRGTGPTRFEEVLPRGGCADCPLGTSRAAAFGDVDNDGSVDIVVVNNGGRAVLLRNRAGGERGWVMFRAVDANGRDALGAAIEVRAGGASQHRLVQVAYSYCAASDARVHFGLGDADTVDEVTVRWPGGPVETFGPFPAGAVHILRRGAGRVPAG
ncbi:MAG: CRTAC1 family protein [Planctomycetota bacterium]